MSKKNLRKKVIGICLVAMMAVAGVGKYAKANIVDIDVPGADGIFYYLIGVSEISQTRGTSYTTEIGSAKCHCSVSATFWWYDSSNEVLYSNGNGAGGMHGASVSMYYNDVRAMASGAVANHTAHAVPSGSKTAQSNDYWPK